MEGYGYSVWLVPRNHAELRERYGMVHIPHVTVETNLERPPVLVPQRAPHIVRNFSEYTPFPGGIYEVDPLMASGFFCQTPLVQGHRPHMSLRYFERMDPPTELVCDLCVADTRAKDPSEWRCIG